MCLVRIPKTLVELTGDISVLARLKWCLYYVSLENVKRVSNFIDCGKAEGVVEFDIGDIVDEFSCKIGDLSASDIDRFFSTLLIVSFSFGDPE